MKMDSALLAVVLSLANFEFTSGYSGYQHSQGISMNNRPLENGLQMLIDAADRNVSFPQKSRRRRYVVFPEGSTFTLAFCVSTKALTGADPNIFTTGINWSLSYDLPNETRHDEKKAPLPIRRHKRDLYQRVEILMASAGFDGRTCVLRTICDTAQLIQPRQGVIQEIIRILFTYEIDRAGDDVIGDIRHEEYGTAQSLGQTDSNCYDHFPCPISLLDLLLQFGVKNSPYPLY